MFVVRRYVLLAVAAVALWAASGCNHEPDPIGFSETDAAAASPDGGINLGDAAPGLPDAAPPCHDAGMMPDAGIPDGAVPDAGEPDADIPDAGPVPDAGPIPDAGPVPCPDAGR